MEKLTKEQIDNLPEWIPVRGFEGFYEVNCRVGLVRNARTLCVKKPSPDNDYPRVGLSKNRKQYLNKVHRIVANAAFSFYNISTDGLDVCHLDETRTNSCIDNLALGLHKENMNFPKFKQRISEANKGEKHPNFGKHTSAEVKKKISEAKKGEKHPNFGKHLSTDVKKKISEALKGKPLSEEHKKKMVEAQPKKAVGAYKNGELIMTFQSTSEAGRNNFSQGKVSECCRGKRRTHRGYVWNYIN